MDIADPRKRPRFDTRAWLLWDDRNLYVAAELNEPNVRARLRQRDAIVFHDNDFEVFIDPDGDGQNYFEIEINALNTIFDLLLVRSYRDGGPAVHEWDVAGLKSAVHIQGRINDATDSDAAWTLEMAIPWTALREHTIMSLPPLPGDIWRMNFSRVQWPDEMLGGGPDLVGRGIEDNWVWSPMGEIEMHIPGRWGFVHFVGE